jgi:hypothetical protein
MATNRITGEYRTTTAGGEMVRAFLPLPLSPCNPPLAIDDTTQQVLNDAEAAMGRLQVAGMMVPGPDWFLYGYVRKEAVFSSQIEGAQATAIARNWKSSANQVVGLTIGGKKSNLSRELWLDFAGYCHIPERAAVRLLSEQTDALDPAVSLIHASLLPDDQKAEYETILRENTELLSRGN